MTTRARSARSPRKQAAVPPPAAPEPTLQEAPGSPLFMQPEEGPETAPAATTPFPSLPPLPSSSLPPSDHDAEGSGSPFGTPSTPDPSAGPAPKKITRAVVRKYAGIAVGMALTFAADALTRPDSIERQAQLWQPDEEDVLDMADPVAGLVARRLPQKAGIAANPDVEDGFMLVIALGKYLGKQWQKHQAIKAARAEQIPDMTAGDVAEATA